MPICCATKVKVRLDPFVDSCSNPLFIRITHTCAHKQICLLNNDLHVYLHIVMRVSKATPGEYLMNNGGKSG